MSGTMTVLVVGAAGQLGRELMRAVWPPGIRLVGADRARLDIADASAVSALVEQLQPEVIVNAAAFTDVERAELAPELADAVNARGVANLVAAAHNGGARLIQISTDYVFDGRKPGWYVESDAIHPMTAYGRSKAAGEAAARKLERHLILRTAWLFGAHGSNFVTKILRAAAERPKLRVVSDQTGCPSSSRDLSNAIVRLVTEDPGAALTGTYHLAGAVAATWFDFASAILAPQLAAGEVAIEAICTADSQSRVPRPANSRLDSRAILGAAGVSLRSWQEALPEVLGELGAGSESERSRSSGQRR